jgi:Uma2 family endonuclease
MDQAEGRRCAETKSELVDGQIHAMSGAKPRHNRIAGNMFFALEGRLRASESPCSVFNSDQRIRSDVTGMNTYPDVVKNASTRWSAR